MSEDEQAANEGADYDQWFAEVGCQEQQEWDKRIEEAKQMSAALEAHRKWKAEFNRQENEHEME